MPILMYFNLFLLSFCKMHGKRAARCESEKNGRTHRRILDDQMAMLYLQKSSEDFLVFVIHDNYLLQWFYTDIWCIIHLKFNILVIFKIGSIRAVSMWSTCYCLCLKYPYASVWKVASAQILGGSKLILLYQMLKL